MTRALERRITCLERIHTPGAGPPLLVLCEPGESKEEAILRTCGSTGLPPRGPKEPPHVILQPLEPS
jgi:hypothetical protein